MENLIKDICNEVKILETDRLYLRRLCPEDFDIMEWICRI